MFNWKKKEKKTTNLEMQEPDRYYKQVKALQNQKRINFSLLGIIVLLVVILGKTVFFYQTKVYIVEKDHNNYSYLGNVADLTKTSFKPQDKDIVFFLNDIVNKMRYLTSDRVVIGKNRRQLNYFLSETARNKLSSYDAQYQYDALQEKGTVVDIEPISVIRLSKSTFQLRWIERLYNIKGQLIGERLLVGAFKYSVIPPKDESTILNNPIGLEIEDFSISQEK